MQEDGSPSQTVRNARRVLAAMARRTMEQDGPDMTPYKYYTGMAEMSLSAAGQLGYVLPFPTTTWEADSAPLITDSDEIRRVWGKLKDQPKGLSEKIGINAIAKRVPDLADVLSVICAVWIKKTPQRHSKLF